MIVRLVLWSLADSQTSVAELRRSLRDEAADEFAEVGGLRLTLWLSDETTERWGAVHLFETREEADQELPTRLDELIGKPPDIVEEFDLDGALEGNLSLGSLSLRGLAFES